jgi:hypothetical protein
VADADRIVAIGLLTKDDLRLLGDRLKRVFRLEDEHDFGELLASIDAAERERRAQEI